MARADTIVDIIKSSCSGDTSSFKKSVEALISEEQSKNHHVLADQLRNILRNESPKERSFYNTTKCDDLIFETIPKRTLNSLFLTENNLAICNELIEEQHRTDLLQSYGLKPRHRVLLKGPPGNGKTSLAEALATELMVPLFTVRYESLIGSYLGETATRLQKVFDYIATRSCVLFFDEFDTLAKERGDTKETGEIKRVVSSLLLQIDKLPSYVVVVTASNHPELLDKAVWRRFQLKLELVRPKKKEIVLFLKQFMDKAQIKFGHRCEHLSEKLYGLNFSEVEDFCLDIFRQSILLRGTKNIKAITTSRLSQLKSSSKKYARK